MLMIEAESSVMKKVGNFQPEQVGLCPVPFLAGSLLQEQERRMVPGCAREPGCT